MRAAVRGASPTQVLVGRDGIQLATHWRREFVGYERIRKVSCDRDAVVLSLSEGELIRLPIVPYTGTGSVSTNLDSTWRCNPEKCSIRRETLAGQIELGLQRFRAASAAAADAGRMLGRGARSIAEWQRALARPNGYRERPIDGEDLLNVLENPRINAEQRLGAALMLAGLPDGARYSDHKRRVDAAIASSANRRFRVALEKAVAGSLDEAAYEAALETESGSAARTALVRRSEPR